MIHAAKEEKASRDHGYPETEDPGLPLLLLRKFSRQDRDKNDVVYAENNFERCQTYQRQPRMGI